MRKIEKKNLLEKHDAFLKSKEMASIKEGFRVKKTPEMIGKIMSILERRTKISNSIVSPVPDHYSNKYGSFVGFFVGYNNGEVLRFNFERKGTSDQFYSIDKYDIKKMKPEFTIDLKGFNVVEVIEYIVDVFTGDFWTYAESTYNNNNRIFEATQKISVSEWLESDPVVKEKIKKAFISGNRRKINDTIRELIPSFEAFLDQMNRRRSANPFNALQIHLKKYFENENIDVSNVPSVEVLPGSSENLITPSTEQEKIYNDLINNEHIYKIKALKRYCFEVKKGNKDFKSLYIYGDGGIGKSFWSKKILGNLPQTVIKTAKVQGYTGLAELLYENREGKILILDDTVTDKDMNNSAIGNILKAALDPDPPRIIEIIKAGRSRESYYDRGKFYLNEEDYTEFKEFENREKIKRMREEREHELDFVDVTTAIDTPSRFEYNSVTIFITNYKKVPQPIEDRCWILKMEFNNKQILDIIRDSLTQMIPEGDIETLEDLYYEVAPDPTKVKALELLSGMHAQNLIRGKLSFRLFNRVVSLYKIGFSKEEIMRNAFLQLGN